MESSELVTLSRNKIHEKAMQITYAFLIYQDLNIPIDFENMISDICELPYSDCDYFLKKILLESIKNEISIIDYCQSFLKNWKFSRLNYCSQAILINSIANFMYLKDTEKPIIINVAVDLAKKYCDKKDYAFINAVLDNCLKNESIQ